MVYAVGVVYSFSRSAVARLVSTSCMRRLGEIRCGRNCVRASSGGHMHTHEDAAAGLCMHLLGARLVQCACFHTRSLHNSISWMAPRAVWKAVSGGVGDWAPANRTRALVRIKEAFWDHIDAELSWETMGRPPYRAEAPQLCQHPIALHPIKAGYTEQWDRLWKALDLRDSAHDEALWAWRRRARMSGHA